MSASRLKVVAIFIWGAILAICGLFSIYIFADSGFRDMLIPARATNILPSATTTMQKPTNTPLPQFYYLPSATARAATAIPITDTPVINNSQIPVLQYSLTLAPDVNPLTGKKSENIQNLERRPVAVKISTFPRGAVRPHQYGLSRADIVYEYYIEDGLTRFIAVYYSQDAEKAGPVRSGRYFDEYIMRMYRSSFVFANADERVENHLLETDLLPLLFLPRDNNCPPLCRDNDIKGYNNMYVDTSGVGPMLSDNSRQNLRSSLFGPLLYPLEYPIINQIHTHYSIYSYNYWQFDPVNQVYNRFSDAADASSPGVDETYAPHIDYLTGVQLSADNVVVLVVPHIFHNEFDRADQLIDITLTGTGDGYLFRDGRMVAVKWIRDEINQPIRLEDHFGQPIPLKPGVTYYQVIDTESAINQIGDDMEYNFFIPLREVTPTPTPPGFKPSPTPRKNNKN